MVKVVGRDETAVKRITCRNCASVLEYVQAEVKTYNGRDYSGGSDGMDWVDCPNCGKKAIIRSW